MPLPAPPGRRIAYDADGTQMLHKKDSAGTPTNLTVPQVLEINNEASDGISPENDWGWGLTEQGYVYAIFAEPKDLQGIFISWLSENIGNINIVEGSTDTTTGVDGTWSTIIADYTDGLTTDQYRTNITSITQIGLTGIRFRVTNWPGTPFRNWHIYGIPGAAADPDRLTFLDPVSEYTVLKDWGDEGQGQLTKQQMAVKNTADVETAESITLAVEGFTGASFGYYTFSIDDTVYTSSLNIGDLVAGAEQTFWLKQDLPPAAPLAQQAARIYAEAASWV